MNDNFNSYSSYKKKKKAEGLSEKKRSEAPVRKQKRSSAIKKTKSSQKIRKKQQAQVQAEEKRLSKEERAKLRKERMAAFTDSAVVFFKKLGVVLGVIFILGEILLIINLHSRIDGIQYEINDAEKQLNQKKEIIKDLNTQRESAYKSETIENLAKYKLGMVYPKKEQIIYVNLD